MPALVVVLVGLPGTTWPAYQMLPDQQICYCINIAQSLTGVAGTPAMNSLDLTSSSIHD